MVLWKAGSDGKAQAVEVLVYFTPAGGEATEITGVLENLSISENEGSRTAEVGFSLSDMAGQYLRAPVIMAGDVITVTEDGEVIYYFIADKASRTLPKRSIEGRDFGLFFEQNEIVIQFDGETVKEAIIKVFQQLGISEYTVPEMGAAVSGVYLESCEEIMEELFEAQRLIDGKEYEYRLVGQKVEVYALSTGKNFSDSNSDEEISFPHMINLRYKPAENVAEFDAGEHHEAASYSHDISGMYNAVRAVIKNTSDSEGLPTKEYLAEDTDLIAKYGRREKLLNVSSEKEAEIEKLAEEELEDASEIKRTLKATLPGCISARKGVCFYFKDEYLGIDGAVRILSVKHNFDGGKYTMDLELKQV